MERLEFLREQFARLQSELAIEQAKLPPEEKESAVSKRVAQAAAYLQTAQTAIETYERGVASASYEADAALISTRVELDYINHPQVDPFVGWVRVGEEKFAAGDTQLMVDSQLLRAFLEPRTSSLVAVQYKPRKIDLVSGVWREQGTAAFIQSLFDPVKQPLGKETAAALIRRGVFAAPAKATDSKIIIHTKDLVRARLSSELSPGVKECKDLIFKAGLGAHLSNSTTGFSVEHWIEAKQSITTQAVALQMNFRLPSTNIDLLSARHLSTFGGISEKVYKFREPLMLRSTDVPDGLHGTRLIDGLGSLVIDIRSAKPLNALCVTADMETAPLEEPYVAGVIVQFFIDARRIQSDDKANTIFVSIF